MCYLVLKLHFHSRACLIRTIPMCGQRLNHMQHDYMRINNDSLWRRGMVLSTTFWLVHIYYRSYWMAIVILFFWNRCYQNCCRIFRLPFITASDFSMLGMSAHFSTYLDVSTYHPELNNLILNLPTDKTIAENVVKFYAIHNKGMRICLRW